MPVQTHSKLYSVGVVGATGLVGQEMLKVLEDRNFPVDPSRLYAFASRDSVGDGISFGDAEILVEELTPLTFQKRKLDFVLFGTSAELSATHVPLAAKS